jgi:hypothetical protein
LPTTVLATAGTPTEQYGCQQLMSFRGNSPKVVRKKNGKKLIKKESVPLTSACSTCQREKV